MPRRRDSRGRFITEFESNQRDRIEIPLPAKSEEKFETANKAEAKASQLELEFEINCAANPSVKDNDIPTFQKGDPQKIY